jgi:hypothetical protein
MKKTTRKRLSLGRETVKALGGDLTGDQLRVAAGGARSVASDLGTGCPTIIDTTSVRPSCRCELF